MDDKFTTAEGWERATQAQRNSAEPSPPKSVWSTPIFDALPTALKPLRNWIVWRGEPPKPGKDKWRKVPYTPLEYVLDANGKRQSASPADTTHPKTWRSFEEAVQAYLDSQKWRKPFDGIGFVFDGKVGDDGLCLCGIDLDEWTEEAREIAKRLNTYTEISPSRRGVHIIVRASPFKQQTCKTDALTAEAYSIGRYFTFSGNLLEGSPSTIEALPDEMAEIVAEIEVSSKAAKPAKTEATNAPYTAAEQSAMQRLKALAALAGGRELPFKLQLKAMNAKRELEELQKKQLSESPLAADEPFDNLGGGVNPLNLEKFKSALWGLSDKWLADEGHWKKICRICANEAMAAGGGSETVEELWRLLDERSKSAGAGEYDLTDNRKHFERMLRAYGKEDKLLTAGSLYWEARDQGWDEATTHSRGGQAPGGPNVAGVVGGANPRSRRLRNDHGPYAQIYNTLLASGNKFSYDQFRDLCLCDGAAVDDAMLPRLRAYCIEHIKGNREPTLQHVREAVEALCFENSFDSEIDRLMGLKWDDVPRLDTWPIVYCGAADTRLNRAFGRKWIIGKVLRGLRPGYPLDTALIVEAKQGVGKTKSARILAGSPDKIIDAPIMHLDAQKQQEALLGKTVYEIAETSDFKKADINSVKAFMSRTHDRARPAYGRSPRNQPRRCAYYGTTDDLNYLPDEENRRFWPVRFGVVNLEALERDCDQLHAEAVAAVVKDGEDCILQPELWAEAAKAQKRRRTSDPWEDSISRAIHRSIAGVSPGGMHDYTPEVKKLHRNGDWIWFVASDELLSSVLAIPKAQQYGTSSKRLQNIMKRLGWSYGRVWLAGKDKTKPTDPDNPRGFTRKVADGEFDREWMEADNKDGCSTFGSSP